MARHIDALTSTTLKNLRERWWDAAFSDFLREALHPRPGTRILDVGCGDGTAELSLGRLRISQLRLFAIDRDIARVARTAALGRSHNFRLGLAGADVARLPFRDGVFDATFCVAVLQHVHDVESAVRELSRVTRPGGRVLVVEPDNSARYWYSSSPVGREAFELASRFFAAAAAVRGDASNMAVGPRLSEIFGLIGLEPQSVQLFPVSVTRIGTPARPFWRARRDAVASAVAEAGDSAEVVGLGAEYLDTLRQYEEHAAMEGERFVEIQNTMLFATLGERVDVEPSLPTEVAAAAHG
jgi:SAM-dependent methyltransferase